MIEVKHEIHIFELFSCVHNCDGLSFIHLFILSFVVVVFSRFLIHTNFCWT